MSVWRPQLLFSAAEPSPISLGHLLALFQRVRDVGVLRVRPDEEADDGADEQEEAVEGESVDGVELLEHRNERRRDATQPRAGRRNAERDGPVAGREKLLGIDVPEAEAEVEADGARPSQDHDGPVVSELVFRDCQGADQGDGRQSHEEGEESAAPDIVLEEGLEDHEGQREECRHDEGDVQVPAEGRGVVDEAVVAQGAAEYADDHANQVPPMEVKRCRKKYQDLVQRLS